ncbi:MAG: tRNA 2-selenouridine(34) synthase MnmH [Reinekea sp.]
MISTADYQSIFLNDRPLMDVRAPVEFAKGAFPNAVNHPLMNDQERAAVGTCYKEAGQQAAIDLGHELVHGDVRQARGEAWKQFAAEHPDGLLYCFRGGLRSRVTQQWLADAGVDLPMVTGGYKAMRQYLLNELHQRIEGGHILVLAGPTGSGKTDVIEACNHAVDLEALANHRGSAFGGTETPQPAQISFENAWSIQWMKRTQSSDKPILFEDESRLIGRIAILPEFLALTKNSPVVALEAPFEERVQRIRRDYAQRFYQHHQVTTQPEQAVVALEDYIRSALQRIQKRLGGVRFKALTEQLEQASMLLVSQNQWSGFDTIIEILLRDYYDPMYTYQFSAKADATVFRGTQNEILQWLQR